MSKVTVPDPNDLQSANDLTKKDGKKKRVQVKARLPDPKVFVARQYLPDIVADPTKTTRIRNDATREVKGMFRDLLGKVKQLLEDNKDLFGKGKALASPDSEQFEDVEYVENIDYNRTYTFNRQVDALVTDANDEKVQRVISRYTDQTTQKGEETAVKEAQGLNVTVPTSPPFEATPRDVALRDQLNAITGSQITSLQQRYLSLVANIIKLGMVKGTPRSEIMRQINQATKNQMWQAERIVRTEIVRGFNVAMRDRLERDGFEYWQWVASQERIPKTGAKTRKGTRTCAICQELHGTVVKIGDPFMIYKGRRIIHPPDPHPNCRCTVRPVTRRDWDKYQGLRDAKDIPKEELDEILEMIKELPSYGKLKNTMSKSYGFSITEEEYEAIQEESDPETQKLMLMLSMGSLEWINDARATAIEMENEELVSLIDVAITGRLVGKSSGRVGVYFT